MIHMVILSKSYVQYSLMTMKSGISILITPGQGNLGGNTTATTPHLVLAKGRIHQFVLPSHVSNEKLLGNPLSLVISK